MGRWRLHHDAIDPELVRWNHYRPQLRERRRPNSDRAGRYWAWGLSDAYRGGFDHQCKGSTGPARRLWTQRGKVDRTDLAAYLPLLQEHIDKHLRWILAFHLRLQLLHLAGSPLMSKLTSEITVIGQLCSACGNNIMPPDRFLSALTTEQRDTLVDDVTGAWREGVRVLERWKGRYTTDHEWMVLELDEDPPMGFIPCDAAFEAL